MGIEGGGSVEMGGSGTRERKQSLAHAPRVALSSKSSNPTCFSSVPIYMYSVCGCGCVRARMSSVCIMSCLLCV